MGFAKKKGQKPKNRKTKTILVWDDNSRVDYLTGFRKRKAERKKYYQDKLKKRMVEERKELKRQAREINKKKMQMDLGQIMPEVEHLVDATEFDLPNHTVTITDITDIDFSSEGGLRLGQNMIQDGDSGDEEISTKKEKFSRANKKTLLKLKKKLQKCGNERKKKPKFSSGKPNSRGVKSKEKKKFKKKNKSH